MYDAYARPTFATPPHHHFAHFQSLRFCSRTAILPPQLAVCELNLRVWMSLTRPRVARSNFLLLADFQGQNAEPDQPTANKRGQLPPRTVKSRTSDGVHTSDRSAHRTTNVSAFCDLNDSK